MSDIRVIDVVHLGTPRAVGAWVVEEQILVDPGPVGSVHRLLAELGEWQPRAIALTHIHLDHAGATGTLLRHWPGTEVWVHEAGAAHLVDPTRLLRSARKVYGDELDHLWGRSEPVPHSAIRTMADGQRQGPFEVAHTPGHASHHLSYLHRRTGTALVGDVAGVRIRAGGAVLMPPVPPEFEPRLWRQSLERIRGWRPTALALTHFGSHDDVEQHLAAAEQGLRDLVATGGNAAAVDECVAALLAPERQRPEIAAAYEQAAQPQIFPSGIARYLERAGAG